MRVMEPKLKYDMTTEGAYTADCQDGACRQPAEIHLLIDEPYPGQPAGTASVIQLCAGHGGPWMRRLRGLVIQTHPFRRGGSACGLEGAEWLEVPNVCRVPHEFTTPELEALAELTRELAGAAA